MEIGYQKYFGSTEDEWDDGKGADPPFDKSILSSLAETIKVYEKIKHAAFRKFDFYFLYLRIHSF